MWRDGKAPIRNAWCVLILVDILAHWSNRVLVYWRSSVSPVLSTLPVFGKILNWLWPTPTRVPRDTSQSDLGGAVDYLARSMTVGLLLPFAAYYTGKLCFKSMENGLKRMLLVSTCVIKCPPIK